MKSKQVALPNGLKRPKQVPRHPLDPSFDISGVKKPGLMFYPEFCDGGQIKALFGFSRSTAYNLAAQGKIRAITFRERGRDRGKRLFNCESIRAFLSKCEE